ncbi:MAG: hypothetical protein K6F76_02730 [Clostridiales bacterium]|nr:hypothetical protein [Clostridiales bacterium]
MKKTFSIFVVLMIIMLSAVTAYADGTTYKIGDKQIKAGDIVTYTVSIEDLKNDVMAINAHVVYDDTVLALISGNKKQESIQFGSALIGSIYNEALENRFLFNCADGVDHLYFEDDNKVITLNFLVNDVAEKADKDITLQFEFIEIYNTDSVTMIEGTDYKIKEDVELNTYKGSTELVDKSKGSINADPSSPSGNGTASAQNGTQNGADITASDSAPYSAADSQATTVIIICCVIAVLLIGIVVILVLGKRREKTDID